MLKDIVVLVGDNGAEEPALKLGLDLAAARGAYLNVVVCGGVPLYQEYLLGTVIYEAYQSEVERQTRKAKAAAEAIEAAMGKAGVSGEVRTLVVDVDILPMDAVVHSRYADMVLVSARAAYTDGRFWDRLVQTVLFHAGRPILIVPEGAKLPLAKVAIAWNASREAIRAVHDGMGLITQATDVNVVLVDPTPSDDGHGAEPGADLAAHLARHVDTVNVHRIPSAGRALGQALQQFAVDIGCDVMVMGAYGHSRMWEMLLGGATRDVLTDTRLPLLISH